ncbi:MAG: SRPBCC family protein [Acidimicrobiales bacterium]
MRTLPAGEYHDPAVHDTERAAIFGREWLCLGPAAAVADPGSYVAETVAGWPLVVARDAAGELRAFHNVCRHRAGPLVDDGSGTCRAFVCRYHGWSYELDGLLRSARDSGLSDADLDGLGLLEVRVATWRGLLCVGLDPELPPIEAWMGADFIAQCEAFAMEAWQPTRRLTHDLACNWKTYSDNYLEGYHIPCVHPALARSIDTSTYAVEVHDGWARHSATARDGTRATGTWLYHWPNLAVNLYEHGMSIERWYPTGPATCTLVLDFCFADTSEAAMEGNHLDVDASERICTEDKAICEAVQRNLAAGAYTDGLLSPRHEGGVADFHARVLRARATEAARQG